MLIQRQKLGDLLYHINNILATVMLIQRQKLGDLLYPINNILVTVMLNLWQTLHGRLVLVVNVSSQSTCQCECYVPLSLWCPYLCTASRIWSPHTTTDPPQ